MTFTILTTLEVASLVVLAVSLHGSVRAVCSDSRRKKMSPLELLSRYPRMYHRLAAVWGCYAVGALALGIALSGAITLVDSGESSPWRTAYAVALDALFVINVLMVAIAIRYYVRSRKYGDYGDESPSPWTERAEAKAAKSTRSARRASTRRQASWVARGRANCQPHSTGKRADNPVKTEATRPPTPARPPAHRGSF